jgi:flagellar export protein FliJ
MAKDLQNLIQIHEWEVDEKRRKLGELLRLLDNLEAQARALEEELVREQDIARNSPEEAGFHYGDYAETVIDRRERIRQSIEQMEQAILDSREELREAYVELKKYEVAQENRERRATLERNRREQIQLDEVGLQGFRRKKKAS